MGVSLGGGMEYGRRISGELKGEGKREIYLVVGRLNLPSFQGDLICARTTSRYIYRLKIIFMHSLSVFPRRHN